MTEKPPSVTESEQSVTREAVTVLARARGSLRDIVTVSRVTNTVTAKRDSAPLRSGTVTLVDAEVDREKKTAKHRAKLAADPRFAGWVAGGSP